MNGNSVKLIVRLLLIFAAIAGAAGVSRAQVPAGTPPPTSDGEIIRIDTDLVQTDVMVFDKKGKFVDGLKPEQFYLKIKGAPRSIPFFEQVTVGSRRDLTGVKSNPAGPDETGPSGRGRTILFFVDDLHLSAPSLINTKKSLLEFIDNSMDPNDQIAITSTSGQLGFLQQFTSDKFILREAVAKLSYRNNRIMDTERPPMSEYQAAQINNGDLQTIEFFVAQLLRDNTIKAGGEVIHLIDPDSAKKMILNRARSISVQSGPSTDDTLRKLEGLMRTLAQLPGRKLLFLVADGFLLTDRQTSSREKVARITESAGRAGVVIYTIDGRGLSNTGMEAAGETYMDVNALLTMSNIGELAASQDGMNALARDTGGTPFRNSNAPISEVVAQVLAETASYYLLAWQPENDEEKGRKFKQIEVGILGRPDLKVRLRNRYYSSAPLELKKFGKKSKDPVKAREDEIRAMIDATLPLQEIPTSVGVTVVPVLTNSSRLTAEIQIERSALSFVGAPPDVAADLDIGAIFYNQKGKPVDSFVGRIRVLPLTEEASEREKGGTVFVYNTWLAPGLYQVRIAVRDIATGRSGSAMQWVQIAKI